MHNSTQGCAVPGRQLLARSPCLTSHPPRMSLVLRPSAHIKILPTHEHHHDLSCPVSSRGFFLPASLQGPCQVARDHITAVTLFQLRHTLRTWLLTWLLTTARTTRSLGGSTLAYCPHAKALGDRRRGRVELNVAATCEKRPPAGTLSNPARHAMHTDGPCFHVLRSPIAPCGSPTLDITLGYAQSQDFEMSALVRHPPSVRERLTWHIHASRVLSHPCLQRSYRL